MGLHELGGFAHDAGLPDPAGRLQTLRLCQKLVVAPARFQVQADNGLFFPLRFVLPGDHGRIIGALAFPANRAACEYPAMKLQLKLSAVQAASGILLLI